MYSCGYWINFRKLKGKADGVDWSEGNSPESAMDSKQDTTGVLDQIMYLLG